MKTNSSLNALQPTFQCHRQSGVWVGFASHWEHCILHMSHLTAFRSQHTRVNWHINGMADLAAPSLNFNVMSTLNGCHLPTLTRTTGKRRLVSNLEWYTLLLWFIKYTLNWHMLSTSVSMLDSWQSFPSSILLRTVMVTFYKMHVENQPFFKCIF